MSQLVGMASGRVQRPSGHHMAPTYNPDLDPSLLLPAALFPTPMPEDPKRKAVAPGWPLGEQPAPGLCLWSMHHLASGADGALTQPAQSQIGEKK